jgi:hypothetical protein
MNRRLTLIMLLLLPVLVSAQEFICQVQVNAPQVEGSEKKVFQTLQQAIYEFINNRKWTNYVYRPEERIECSMIINITDRRSSDQFSGKISVVLQRPVYKTSYNTTLLNYIDKDFDFRYVELEHLSWLTMYIYFWVLMPILLPGSGEHLILKKPGPLLMRRRMPLKKDGKHLKA